MEKIIFPTRKNIFQLGKIFFQVEQFFFQPGKIFFPIFPGATLQKDNSRVSNIESDNSQNVGLEDYNNISDRIFPHFTTLSIKISLG